MLSVIDFSNMSLKEISSLSENVKNFLNHDNRLNGNSNKRNKRLGILGVKEEIMKDNSNCKCHCNNEDNNFQEKITLEF